jgi:hypothetical protein
MITADTIREYFRQMDRRFLDRGQNAWVTGLRGRLKNYQRGFYIFIVLGDPWLYFQVPFVTSISEGVEGLLNDYLLRLNYRMCLAKFAINSNQIMLLIDIPISSLNLERFYEAFDAIDRYIQQYYLEIDTIAHDPALTQAISSTVLPAANIDDITPIEEDLSDILFNT